MSESASALSGLRIIDFSHVFQGPMGSQLLADYGADVIKVERPGAGDWSRQWGPFIDGVSMPFASLNRNKRSIAVDLKAEEGKEIIRRLARTSDVLMHNFRPGVMDGLGLGYEDLKAINPRLVYAYSTGWGDEGPYVKERRPGHDLLARAATGWLNPEDPAKPPVVVGISADYPAGLMLVLGIMMALKARERTGEGQLVTTDLYSVALHANTWHSAQILNRDAIEDDGGLGATEAALDKVFETTDGYIELSPVFSSDSLRDISVAMDLGDLSLDPRFREVTDRVVHRVELNAILAERFREKTTAEWIEHLKPRGVLCTEIRRYVEAVDHPQTHANKMVVEAEHPDCGAIRLLGTPVRLHATGPGHDGNPPRLGEHGEGVLEELGYTPDQIAQLKRDGVLA